MTPFSPSPALAGWRGLLALAVVFIMLTTTGWTAERQRSAPRDFFEAESTAWRKARVDGRALPGTDSTPSQLATFFASLDGARSDRLAQRFPLVVGNLNGAPVALRYRANRTAIARSLAVETQRRKTARLTAEGRHHSMRRIHRFQALMRPGRQILAFDPAGSGRAAEVFGSLERADRVSVIVPGVDTNLLTFQRSARKYSAPVGMAQSLYAAERVASPRTRTAVIAWADYVTPAGLGMDSATGRLAENGAVRLTRLVDALPGASEIALFCHSYGSVVCGLAARQLSPRVTDIAVAGSPGMRAGNVTELRARARVWAMRDRDDWIEDVPHLQVGGLGHGADPMAPEFGARVMSADGAIGHSGYFEPGTESIANLAVIGVGSYAEVVCSPADIECGHDIFGVAAA
ncbi:alpha/beta hydrolase [Streptomyces sp. NPDC056500]|uniref:alpha/beta hydrolase n=1 Tax=Streptomyces sp. NPDC056500 TaxID=3345840 RepID=UPI0036C75473